MSNTSFASKEFIVNSPNVTYTEEHITTEYHASTPVVDIENGSVSLESQHFTFKTDRHVPKVGVMLVGWGGNNGSTLTAGILANKLGITWHTKEGVHNADYLGSLTQASTVPLGTSTAGATVHIPFNKMLPMVDPNDFVLGGWDISSANLADSMERSQVSTFLYMYDNIMVTCVFNLLLSAGA
jgi:myo-inositol-1-phosphate synthase